MSKEEAPQLVAGIDDKIPVGKSIVLGLQHILSMDLYIMPLILGGAIGLQGGNLSFFLQMSFFACGIATLLQSGMFMKYPIAQGPSYVPLGALCMIGATMGIPTMIGSLIPGALIVILLGVTKLFSKFIRKAIPPFIGGIIKKYEYSMIPYILAENPTMGRKDAFFLSRQLMRGNKWRMFLLHLSFIGWSILSLLTFGILDFLFVNPYQTATDAELYMTLRKNYIRSRAPRYELFNDPLLEQELSDDELLIRKALYDDSEGPYTKIAYFEPHQYPAFLFSVQPPVRAVHQPLAPTGSYHPLTLASLFFLFSILG